MDLDTFHNSISFFVCTENFNSVGIRDSEKVRVKLTEVIYQCRLFRFVISNSSCMVQTSAVAGVSSLTKVLSLHCTEFPWLD